MSKLEENPKVGFFRTFANMAAVMIGLSEGIVIKEAKMPYCPVFYTDQVMLKPKVRYFG